jgi:hypothetical protein
MTAPRDFLVLTGAPALPSGGAEQGVQIERAAELVADFTSQNTLPALEDLLDAVAQPVTGPAAEALRRKANKLSRQTTMLFEEVAHFLTHPPGG